MTLSAYLRRTLTLGLGLLLTFATLAGAQALRSGIHAFPARGVKRHGAPLILKSTPNLVFHGGPVITSAHVVFIF
ncbi:MAG TPA: hypothetical protein VGM86_15140 [Thermoanaerobaculia bacterium]|jgi:hypothetical protein